ncbi:pfEMP1 [Plasmodium falciparum HB3]|uniref:PfEMP1 n=1 Tax=Plasmodium falciparum (isolate HB3) TaxID=137071 RepID=A0A0L7KMD2_PLAFX|nr:pfEMP1 [Plasmodium falciparum HB3]
MYRQRWRSGSCSHENRNPVDKDCRNKQNVIQRSLFTSTTTTYVYFQFGTFEYW